MNVPKPKGLKIEYFNEEEVQEEEPVTTVDVEFVDSEVIEPEENPAQPEAVDAEDDLNEYVYNERVGTLELINYLPRVPKAVLRGERDFTPEEWVIAQEDLNRGFRPIHEAYIQKYQVPDDFSKFRTQEDLSRDITKVSPGMVGKWVKVTTGDRPRYFPAIGLIKDDFGFTQYAVAIYRNLMRYTCKRRYIADENGLINWEGIDRDATPPPIKDPSLSEENPDYALCSLYWEKLADQHQDWCDRVAWLTEYKQARSLREQEPEVINFSSEADRELYRQMSQFAARVELAKRAALKHAGLEFDDLNRQVVNLGRQKGAEGWANSMEAYAGAFNQGEPQPLEEESDIWDEQPADSDD